MKGEMTSQRRTRSIRPRSFGTPRERILDPSATRQIGATATVREALGDYTTHLEEMVEQMLAIAQGLAVQYEGESVKRFTAGNTADLVALTPVIVPVMAKFDANKKVLAEGAKLAADKVNLKLPQSLRDALPTIYAYRAEPPYGYLMGAFDDEYYDEIGKIVFLLRKESERGPLAEKIEEVFRETFGNEIKTDKTLYLAISDKLLELKKRLRW
jgi:hypothetical protein